MSEFYPKSPFIDGDSAIFENHIMKANPEMLEVIKPWLCRTPRITTYRVNSVQKHKAPFRRRLDKLLASLYEQPPATFEIEQLPEIVCINAINCPVPQPSEALKEVVVDACCGAAVLRGAHIYAPGVLAMQSHTQLNEQVNVYADLAGRMCKGANTRLISDKKLYLGRGLVKMQRHQLYCEGTQVSGVAVQMCATISGVPTLGDLSNSEVLLQNLPSIVAVHVLQPRPHEHVLDMCAAPGNKTFHIAQMMQDTGVLMALDKSPKKIEAMRVKTQLAGLSSIRLYAYDSTQSYDDDAADKQSALKPPFAAASFDRILLDAPCSALGNRPVLAVKNLSAKVLESYPKVQRRLFFAAVQLLKPGGTLVYSTCTITEAENELLVAWALETFTNLVLVDATPRFGGAGLPGLGLTDEQRRLVQRFGPENEQNVDTIGFFIAKFMKTC